MKRVFGADIRRAEHALRVADYAERIAQQEQADMGVVLIAAYLHDIGIPEAERRYDNPDEQCHERLGAPAARTLLENIGAEAPLIDEVCDIIGRHHRPGPEETINYKAVYDADLLVNRMQKYADSSQCRDTATDVCANGFLTEAGKRLAAEVILQNSGKREV
jgi:putative nucleotidyltransferase with HDIG domain